MNVEKSKFGLAACIAGLLVRCAGWWEWRFKVGSGERETKKRVNLNIVLSWSVRDGSDQAVIEGFACQNTSFAH